MAELMDNVDVVYKDGAAQVNKGLASAYSPAYISIAAGLAADVMNSPITSAGKKTQRHCTAWEEFSQIITLLCDAIDLLDSSLASGASAKAAQARALVDPAKMLKNQGE